MAPLFVAQTGSFKFEAVDALVAEAYKSLTERTFALPCDECQTPTFILNFPWSQGFKLHQEPVQFAAASKAHFLRCGQGAEPGFQQSPGMVFLQAQKKLFGADASPAGEDSLKVCRGKFEHCRQVLKRWLGTRFDARVCAGFKVPNGLFNQLEMFVGFESFHVDVWWICSSGQCLWEVRNGQSVSCGFPVAIEIYSQVTLIYASAFLFLVGIVRFVNLKIVCLSNRGDDYTFLSHDLR